MNKNTFTLCMALAIAISALAQIPQAFHYQAVVRNNAGEPLQNQEVCIRISIHENTAGGAIVYQETFTKITNDFGLVNLEVGNGTPTTGLFSAIDWANNTKFLELEFDQTGGNNYVSMGTSQLLSVPFALHATTSGNDGDWTKSGNDIYLSPTGNVGMGTIAPDYKLDITGDAVADDFRIRRQNDGSETVHKLLDAGGYIQYFNAAGNRGHDFVTNDGNTVESRLRIIGNGRVGIGTSSPSQKLEVNGPVKIGAYTLPSIDGSDGQFLKTNGSGSVSWSNDNTLSHWTESSGHIFRDTGNVGIDVSTPGNILDIQVDTTTGTHATGLPLYVTDTIGADTNGIEFRHSNATQGIGFGYNTVYATGTNTNQDLTLKSKGNGVLSFKMGEWELWRMTGSRLEPTGAITTVYIGLGAGYFNASFLGGGNVGLGDYNSFFNTTGVANTAIGKEANYYNNTGNSNTAIGYYALENTKGGDGNTVAGYEAAMEWNPVKSKMVVMGSYAGDDETGSDVLLIDNSVTSSHLIQGNFSDKKIQVNGDLVVDFGNLHVKGYFGQGAHWYCYHNNVWPYVEKYYAASNYSIRADHNIRAHAFHALSDQRIKTNFQRSNNLSDLAILNKIQVTDYKHIDTLSKGSANKKGFIAQQVESVYPEAVKKSRAFVPDIYSFSIAAEQDNNTNSLLVSMDVEHKLEKGDVIKFYTDSEEYRQEVLEIISPVQFRVAAIDDEFVQLFIFGKEVDDFRSVDYDQVFTLGASAITELSRQNEELKMKNEILRSRLENIESILQDLDKSNNLEMVSKTN